MSLRVGLALICAGAAMLCAQSALAQAGPDVRFEDGSPAPFTARPNHSDVWRAMDEAGLSRSDVEDWAVVACTIGDSRRLRDCEIVEESAPDTEVGEAILAMVRRYRAASVDASGASTIGRRVYLAMGYAGIFIP